MTIFPVARSVVDSCVPAARHVLDPLPLADAYTRTALPVRFHAARAVDAASVPVVDRPYIWPPYCTLVQKHIWPAGQSLEA
nr:hypothetical protein [Miniimonas arenae]